VRKAWIRLKKELATLGEKLPPVKLLPAKRKKQSADPTKKDASKNLLSAERRQRDSLKRFERSVEVRKAWIRLKKELATLGEKLPAVKLLPAKRKKQSADPTKKDASKEEFGRRALAGGNMWDSLSCLLTLLGSFDKNTPEMGTGSVARQMHQKTVQHYWVNIVKQQVTGGGVPHLRTR